MLQLAVLVTRGRTSLSTIGVCIDFEKSAWGVKYAHKLILIYLHRETYLSNIN